ncbi:MAG: alkaline phosphatase D family protein [Bacteroidota bacterium]
MKIVAIIGSLFICVFTSWSNQLLAKEPVFRHGVASGDPLPDGVIIWTRVNTDQEEVAVEWEVAKDRDFINMLYFGKLTTNAEQDYTLKVDVGGLEPNRTYFYRFRALGEQSMVGRTRTAPQGDVERIRLAVVSCSNYEAGYFNAYARIADRKGLNAVIHLGDYIYEYGQGVYGDESTGRMHQPPHEVVTLEDYRTRYGQYRLDRAAQMVHQAHPFIMIWDDHEIANNAHSSGAQNHQTEKEGSYQKRKAAARQAYLEWMPVRENERKEIYRNLKFGNLAELVMLDERLAGRSEPVKGTKDEQYLAEERSMLGAEQFQWMTSCLKDCGSIWKIIGNQVLFSDLNLQEVRPNRPLNMDAWDGYPAEKRRFMDFLQQTSMQNVIFVTGDTHASWAFEVPADMKAYRKDGSETVAVEFGTTSISSANWDERLPVDSVKTIEKDFARSSLNPHLKYINLRDHGYLLLTLRPNVARAEWWYVDTVKQPSRRERLGRSYVVKKGTHKLRAMLRGGSISRPRLKKE